MGQLGLARRTKLTSLHEILTKDDEPTATARALMRLDNDRSNLWRLYQAGKQALPTPEYQAERFPNKIERPSEFFHRVFQARHAAVMIPHRSVLDFYTSALHDHQDSIGRHNPCACGCGQPAFDRKKWASAGCRKEYSERCHRQPKPGGCGMLDFIEFRLGQKQPWLLTPSLNG